MSYRDPNLSRQRSLLGDIARGLEQQMFYWGRDARHREGNLLVIAGFERIAREEEFSEGSSRYRMKWEKGLIELHSYCVGWYGAQPGAVYIRHLDRFFSCHDSQPITPGKYESRSFREHRPDDLSIGIRPLLRWILHYESIIADLMGSEYRNTCWEQQQPKPGATRWLNPIEARLWFENYLDCPEAITRPRQILRSVHRSSPYWNARKNIPKAHFSARF